MTKSIYLILALLPLLACQPETVATRDYIDLSGQWEFALDTADIGIEEKWYLRQLADSISLPGTTDSNQKGWLNRDTTTMHLSRLYKYEGAAWYRKKVIIPPTFDQRQLQLYWERSKPSQVWIDSTYLGESILLQSPQRFDATSLLTPGEHHITVRVDNSLTLTPYGHVHIYSDDTQTNWNGFLGQMHIASLPTTHIADLQVYPDLTHQSIDVKLKVKKPTTNPSLTIELSITLDGENVTNLTPQKTIHSGDSVVQLSYVLGDQVQLWDEYNQPVYHLTATISSTDETIDIMSVPFGMRSFEAVAKQFQINGKTTFLRGKHEAGVFPLTGHVPMDVDSWIRVYEISKSYGINHYRFHSYCPPEAAFTAADQTGIYLQVELPFWGGLESDTVAMMLREEGLAMLRSYANHPSFVMLSHGNEIWSGHDRAERNIVALKAFDSRPLYTFGSNNNIGYMPPTKSSDFFVASRTPSDGDTTMTHTRLTHAFADSRGGGSLNTKKPNTETNFDYPISQTDMPLVSHEIGQYQIYPDYQEIKKYTGVLRAWNLEVFQERLKKAGMLDQDSLFQKATGAWSALCYKAEMEAALRTEQMAGFQLLDLQDFPGQGTALVGVLDAFMDDKEVVSREQWLQSCNNVVLLMEFPKYVWTNTETFESQLKIANYSNQTLTGDILWRLVDKKGNVIQEGHFDQQEIPNGRLNTIGSIAIHLSEIETAKQLTLHASIAGTTYSNQYDLWVYPSIELEDNIEKVFVSKSLNQATLDRLEAGQNVLLFPQSEGLKDKSVAGHFPPEFWNYGMFKGISEWVKKTVSPGTLGLCMDPEHPLFRSFPTDYHTNWQWFSIIKASRSLFLDSTSAHYKPIVQVVDNLERNHKLGLIFEFKVGEGKLLVCMSDLERIIDQPEAAQLYQAMLNYMNSTDFSPQQSAGVDELKALL
ncbi:Beta-galactosidase/beta-glucuronidase [Reichenbachiella agariperforans]|uniref:Beta-galactosidase/beta-glucuronidase n=1 Tax=Reichenbachiella agariperforans TaxID=156994 RepID=A0A1M6Q0L6_REIAG|nr:sugar-binding domain-containing protein [Reichenbachiella agariperforans]SHK13656.1 Beta-galactosidase/beta-glucuronidase [Reichenbachiella agariperforans]